jgi:hypothetical protein
VRRGGINLLSFKNLTGLERNHINSKNHGSDISAASALKSVFTGESSVFFYDYTIVLAILLQ